MKKKPLLFYLSSAYIVPRDTVFSLSTFALQDRVSDVVERTREGASENEGHPSGRQGLSNDAFDAFLAKPADELFKWMLRSKAEAVSVLRSALPAELRALFDWDTLKQVPTEHLDRWLSKRYGDLVFQIAFQGPAEDQGFLFVLFEHQGQPDAMMPLRFLGMMTRFWERWLRDNPKARRLPFVMPVVLYPGQNGRPWRYAVRFAELLEGDARVLAALSPFIPDFRFVLDDLRQASAEALYARQLTEFAHLTLRLLRDAGLPNFLRSLENPRDLALWSHAAESPDAELAYVPLFLYLYRAVDGAPEEVQAFARKVGRSAKEAEMTAAQRLIETAKAQGRLEGKAEGRLEGKAEGRLEGSARSLKRLIALRFGSVDAKVLARLECGSEADLERWTERILNVSSLEDLFE